MKLNDRAVLVKLSISQWTARKYDKKATKEVTDAHNASETAGRFNKALLPMNNKLDNIIKKSALIRNEFYKNTLPWGIDGTQILPTGNYLDFMAEFRKERDEWNALVRDFINSYDAMRANAQKLLGSLYDPADYPTEKELWDKFDIDLAVFPVPSTDFRVSLGDDELARIQEDVERRLKNAEQVAMKELYTRLYEKVKHMAEKLSDPDAIFRDSMVENLRELCDMLPRLNFNDDPNLEALRAEVEKSLIRNPDMLREDLVLRQSTAAKANDIIAKMASFMQ